MPDQYSRIVYKDDPFSRLIKRISMDNDRSVLINRKQFHRAVLVFIVTVHCLACNQSPKHTPKQAVQQDAGKSEAAVKTTLPSSKEVFPAYTDPVYTSYISPALKALMEEKLPGWRLPPADSWEKYWFDAYRKADALVDYVSGDFDGDRKADYALLLENENHAFVVWVLQSQSNGYGVIELTELTGVTLPLNAGLELVSKGNLNYLNMDDDTDTTQKIKLEHQAIQVSYFEASAATYYWKDGRYQSVTTGD